MRSTQRGTLKIVGVLLALVSVASSACDGQQETLGSLTQCTPTACPTSETWDSLQCACVPVHDAGCPLMAGECPTAEQFDPLTCRCVIPVGPGGMGVSREGGDEASPMCQMAPPGGGGPCAAGYRLDPLRCVCTRVRDGGHDAREDSAVCMQPPVACANGFAFDETVCGCLPVGDGG